MVPIHNVQGFSCTLPAKKQNFIQAVQIHFWLTFKKEEKRQTCFDETNQKEVPPPFPQMHICTALTTLQIPPFHQRSHMEQPHPTCRAFLSLFRSLPHLKYFLLMPQDTQEHQLRKGVCHLWPLKRTYWERWKKTQQQQKPCREFGVRCKAGTWQCSVSLFHRQSWVQVHMNSASKSYGRSHSSCLLGFCNKNFCHPETHFWLLLQDCEKSWTAEDGEHKLFLCHAQNRVFVHLTHTHTFSSE